MSARRYPLFLPILVLLLAAALRFFHLDAQSFWSDEGNSAAMVGRDAFDIVRRSGNDISPPLYYLLLAGWGRLVGTSEFALRALSVGWSLLTVALTWALGNRIGGRRVALLAALFAALSPFALHYAQEARMYAMVAALAAGSWCAWVEVQGPKSKVQSRTDTEGQKAKVKGQRAKITARGDADRRSSVVAPRGGFPLAGTSVVGRPGWWAYVLLSAAMLYTQYFAVSVLVAQGAAWLLLVAWERWRTGRVLDGRARVGRWVASQLAIAALFLPWFLYVVDDILGWPAVSPPVTPGFLLREVFRIFGVGLANEAMPAWAALGFAALLVAGLTAARRGGRALLPLFIFGVPPLLMLLLSLDRPFWNAKFLLVALPGYHLLLAQGAVWLAERAGGRIAKLQMDRFVGAAVALFAVLAVAPTLANEYGNPRFWRDDYRAIARTIAAQAGPTDAVILNGGGQLEIWDYYDKGTLPVYPMPPSRPLDPDATRAELEGIAARHERVWVLWWAEQQGDPEGVIPRWLGEHAFEAGSRWFGDVRVASYRLGELPAPAPLDVRWALPDGAARLHLRGASVEPLRVVAGDVVAINSLWEGESDAPVTFFAQLLDGGNHLAGQYDGSGGAPPVAEWGGKRTLRLGVPVAVGTPPGDYSLMIGAYDAASGQRLVTSEGADALRLATVRVEKPVVPPMVEALALRPGEARAARFGGITLVGARANKLGWDHAPDTPLAPGEPLGVLLFWRAERDAPAAPALQLQMMRGSTIVAEWPLEPTEGRYPVSSWSAEELVRDPQVRFLPGDLAPGRYRLVLAGEDARADVGEIIVNP